MNAKRVGGIIIGFVVVCIALLLLQRRSTSQSKELQQTELRRGLLATANIIETQMMKYTNGLYGVRAAFSIVSDLSREQYERYVASLNVLRTYPGLSAFGYGKLVRASEKQAFVDSVRQDRSKVALGYPQFTIYPESEKSEYIVLTYIEPNVGNEKAFGFDLSSDPIRMQAIQTARDSNRPTMTGKIFGVASATPTQSILIVLPIYDPKMPTATVEQRRKAFLGVINAGFRLSDMFSTLFQHERTLVRDRVEIFDGQSPELESLLYDSNPAIKDLPVVSDALTTTVAQRQWYIRYSRLKE